MKRLIDKGSLAEEIVFEAAQQLKTDLPIRDVIRASKGGEIDSLGIDILVFLKGGFILPIQVKSSQMAAEKHLYKHPLITGIIVMYGVDELISLVRSQRKNATLDDKLRKRFVREAKGLIQKNITIALQELRANF